MSNEYKAALIGGDNVDLLTDLLERLCCGEPVGTEEDAYWASGLLKYQMVDNQCHNGAHFDSLLAEMGYKKEGGAI